jgi:hypothetical protein
MSKIVDLLNKDVGSIATKVLKADVADIVKGAGRALNTDVGTIAKGAGKVLTYDLGDLFNETPPNSNESQNTSANPASETAPNPAVANVTTKAPAPAAAAEPHVAPPGSTGAFVPVAPASPKPAGSTEAAEPPKARLTEALVNRQRLAEPSGQDLLELLPLKVGNYERAKGVAQGDIASDPVNVTYSGNGEAVSVSVVSCWDIDEAREKLDRGRSKLENSRGSNELNWVAGIDSRGVVFIWVRNNFCYEVVSPRGVSPIARFLGDFPY